MREISRRVSVAALFVTLAVLMSAAPVAGQEPEQEPADPLQDLEDWERAEIQSLAQAVRAALQGRLTPTENPFELQPSFFKQADDLTYVPFTVTVDPARISESVVTMYLFVTAHQDPPAAPADPDSAEEPVPQVPRPVFEDAYFIDVSAERAGGGQIYLSRAFTAPGGDYDVYIAMRDSLGGPVPEDQESASVLMIKEEVSVPNLWTTELQTSSVLVAEVVELLTAPLTPDEQVEQPYTFPDRRIVPKYDRRFRKKDRLSFILIVYNSNPTTDQKPDVTVEYNFHQRTDAGEEFFNKTPPLQFNAQTLPPEWDMALGHQIDAGQSVALSVFPAGDYRLEITISDNEAGTSVTRDVHFTVQET